MLWKHLWTFILGLVFLYIQLLVMPSLRLFGVIPNLLLPWLVYLVWNKELNPILIVGFLIGLLYDTTQPESFGMHALVFVLVILGTDRFRRPFEARSVIARILTLLIACLIFHLISFLVLGVVYGFSAQFSLSAIGFGYDLLISFVGFWTMQFVSRLRIVAQHD